MKASTKLSDVAMVLTKKNFMAWKVQQIDECTKEYGSMANVMTTNEEYIPPHVVAADYHHQLADGEDALTAGQIRELQIDAIKSRARQIRNIKENAPKFYAHLYQTISVDSRMVIEHHENYIVANLNKDPNLLWAIIQETHLTNVDGGAEETRLFTRRQLVNNFAMLRQKAGVPIGVFKTEYDEYLKTMIGAGEEEIGEPDKSIDFLLKLDPKRYGQMLKDLRNDASRGTPMPQTLHAAYTIASGWKNEAVATDLSGNLHSVFTFADEVEENNTGGMRRGGGRNGIGQRPAGRGRNDSSGHSESSGRGGRHGRGNRGSRARGRSGRAETRTCRGCLQKGHLYAQCPDNLDTNNVAVLTAFGDESDDEGDGFDFTLMIQDTEEETRTLNAVLFTSTQILLDNQAGRGLFRDGNLTDDPQPGAFRIGGIDGTSVELKVSETGMFEGLCRVGIHRHAVANILSMPELVDLGHTVTYDSIEDAYTVVGPHRNYLFVRNILPTGKRSRHYVCDLAKPCSDHRVLVETVANNERQYTKREVKNAVEARTLMERLGHPSAAATIEILNAGVLNCSVTGNDVRVADAVFGPSVPSLKGKTVQRSPLIADIVLAPRVTQVQQCLSVDIFFVAKLPFLLGVLSPLGLSLCGHLNSRSAVAVRDGINGFISTTRSRGFDLQAIRTDGEGGVLNLGLMGIKVERAGPGQHVPVAERRIRSIKERVRSISTSLPYTLTRRMIIMCVLFCVSRGNFQRSTTSMVNISPTEQFTGRKLDAKLDLRIQFGDYVQATVPATDSSMKARTQGCIALLPTGNLTGSVRMWCLSTDSEVIRDQFKVLPLPDAVIAFINAKAKAEGYTRVDDLGFDLADMSTDETPLDTSTVPTMKQINDGVSPDPLERRQDDGESNERTEIDVTGPAVSDAVDNVVAGAIPDGVAQQASIRSIPSESAEENANSEPSSPGVTFGVSSNPDTIRQQRSNRGQLPKRYALTARTAEGAVRTELRKQFSSREDWHDKDFAFTMSVKAAMRERGAEAEAVIMAEIQQMVDKGVWHGVKLRSLSKSQKKAIIRSSMFLKDKYFASGAFDKFKARLVAGGNQQNKELYESLSSPTAATCSVMTVAAIAAKEGREVVVIDIGGAYLNADITSTGIKVHMRLDKLLTSILLKIDPKYEAYVEENGTCVVELDKALYGCVEAAALWYQDLKGKLVADGFVENPYDACVFNKCDAKGDQVTIALHVDDLMVTAVNGQSLVEMENYLRSVYPEIKTKHGKVVDYIGMTFDFTVSGQVSVTMENCINEVLLGCGVTTERRTPASETLFIVRDSPRLSDDDSKYFHSYVAKLLYLAKRVRPECLTAVSFLATRVQICDTDDLAKLHRLLGYLNATRKRGIVLKIGERMVISAYIDAAYGVHLSTGKSHAGGFVVLGDAGPLFAKSTKQKIVTKSSTEAELVGVSDLASQAIHMRNFVIAQGYALGPAIIYQDNMSCMALLARGRPGSERSRHINIRHFWVSERVANKEIAIEHMATERMWANILTKPIQGAQFVRERQGLTNWE